MFGKKKREDPPIIESGATVLRVQDTGTTINNNPRVVLTLRVEPEQGEPFEIERKVTVSRVNVPRTGDHFRVKYFQGEPDSARVQKRTEADLAASAVAAAAAPVPVEDPLDRLTKLNELRQTGALTEDEFTEQKAKILAAG